MSCDFSLTHYRELVRAAKIGVEKLAASFGVRAIVRSGDPADELLVIAKEVGATKIALGHHADDFIETLLLNLFFAGALKAMPAKLVSDDGAHVVIRPLVYVGEEEARAYAKESELPIIGCCCPACGDLSLQRQRMKRLLMELESEHPTVKQSMLKALSNVAPRHLLDTRLNPPADLRARGEAEPEVRLKPDTTDVRPKPDAAVRRSTIPLTLHPTPTV